MTTPFHERRRQPFISQTFYDAEERHKDAAIARFRAGLQRPTNDAEDQARLTENIADDSYRLLSLRYTGGEAPASLRTSLEPVIEAYERYQKALGEYEGVPTMSPLGLDYFVDYERAVQLIGLCYLLHRRDLISRLSRLIDPGYRGEDTLYEDLLSYHEEGRVDLDEWYHDVPYTPLVKAMYATDPAEATKRLQEYVDNWYEAFERAPWHDGHLRINGTEGDYFGYWAFEAGAVALLCEIDDSSIDHIVYPKDLVAWARANAALSEEDSQGRTGLRCLAGQPCPRTGLWFTPARVDSRRQFAVGEVMPEVGGDYGATIWQWDDRL
jgi:hypothetical protein